MRPNPFSRSCPPLFHIESTRNTQLKSSTTLSFAKYAHFNHKSNELRESTTQLLRIPDCAPFPGFTILTELFSFPDTLDLNSNLLPESFPEGDPSEYALPVFLEGPQDAFAVRGKPAVLKCRVAHALRVFFRCNDEVMRSDSESNLVDPETSIRYTEVTVEVKRGHLLDVLGSYSCKCAASSSRGEVESDEAIVRMACKFNIPNLDPSPISRFDGQKNLPQNSVTSLIFLFCEFLTASGFPV